MKEASFMKVANSIKVAYFMTPEHSMMKANFMEVAYFTTGR